MIAFLTFGYAHIASSASLVLAVLANSGNVEADKATDLHPTSLNFTTIFTLLVSGILYAMHMYG
jgi:hypothetical protein